MLDIGFDIECLDGLDDLLLLSPVDAFATVCWDNVIKPTPKPLRQPLPRSRPERKSTVPFPRRRPPCLTIVKETSSVESGYESGSDELRTLKDEATPLQSPLSSAFPSPLPSPYDTGFHLNHQPTVEPIKLVRHLPHSPGTMMLTRSLDQIQSPSIRDKHFLHHFRTATYYQLLRGGPWTFLLEL